MKLIELEERKQIQMDILEAVDRFCAEHDIKYSIACGTLLGAVRHGGYIPWDDDIDIYMLREDYEKFEALFPNLYLDHLELWSISRKESWNQLFSKIADTRTLVKEKILKDIGIGINIDLFPIDDVPENEEEWLCFNHKRRKDYEIERRSTRAISKCRPLWQNVIIGCSKIYYAFFNNRKFALYRNRMIQQHNGKGSTLVFESSSGMRVKRPFPKRLFDDIIEIAFEDRKFKCFKDYHEYLTDTFGEYMVLPPIEKRISLHTYDTYWI